MIHPKLSLTATVPSRFDATSYLKKPGDAVIVERKGLRWLILVCPCGCGSEVPVNLDPRAGPAWRLYQGIRGLSVYPSVWRDTDCESHFVILRNTIFMFGSRYDDLWLYEGIENEETLEEQTLYQLSIFQDQSCEEISLNITGSIPWDVLRCCRKLCRKGLAIEGRGENIGRFRKASMS